MADANGPKSETTTKPPPPSAGMRKFRRTASIVASTLLAGGSSNSATPRAENSARAKSGGEAAAVPSSPAKDTTAAAPPAAPPSPAQKNRSIAHLKPPASASDSFGGSAKLVSPKSSFMAAVTAAKDVEKKKKKASLTKAPSIPSIPGGDESSKKRTIAGDKDASTMPLPLEWLVVLLALVFKLGVNAVMPLGLMVGGWSFLFMSDVGKKLTSGRLGPLERRVLWASASVLIALLLIGGNAVGDGDPEAINQLSQQNNILRDASDATRRENELLKEKANAVQIQLEECHASTGMVASKQHDLKTEIDEMRSELGECNKKLTEYTKFDLLSAEEQYRELLQRQGVLFGQLSNSKTKVMNELHELESSLETLDDKKKQVSDWIQTHKGDTDFTKWMEELSPKADELTHIVEEKRDRVMKLNKTLTLPCPFENQSLTMLRHEIDQQRKLAETLMAELESVTKTKNMTLSENYKYILTEEKDTFGELQRAKVDLEKRLEESGEIRDILKKKRDRVMQWMQQDSQARNDNDLVRWLKQLEPQYNEVEGEIRDIKDKLTRINDTITLRSKLCEKTGDKNDSIGGGSVAMENEEGSKPPKAKQTAAGREL